MAEVVARRLTPTVYTRRGVASVSAAAAAAAAAAGAVAPEPVPVHVKVDTGMHRVGADPGTLLGLAQAVAADPALAVGALWTHLAVADGTDPGDQRYTVEQLDRLDRALAMLHGAGIAVPLVHVANSAATFAYPEARRSLVRCGIALYGAEPGAGFAGTIAEVTGGGALRPALSWKARVSMVRRLDAGERPSYGRRRPLPEATLVATVPVGYADGVPRRLFDQGGTVLVGGCRRPLAGTVTMDQILVDCGPVSGAAPPVRVGDEVVLLGSQGGGTLRAEDWASTLGTISYEVLCGIGPRVPRRYTGGSGGAVQEASGRG